MADTQENFLQYYERELGYLRRRGAEFALQYPKVAGRLELGADASPDPNVERLLESFAFLTARLQQRVDGEFPELTSAILGLLYPQLVNPIPSMAIAQFDVDPEQGSLTSGYEIERHSSLFAETPQGLTCRFQTCYPVTLWPVQVAEAGFVPPERYDFLDAVSGVATVLRLKLEARPDPFQDLELGRLRFYLSGSASVISSLYELLFAHTSRVAVLPEGSTDPVYLPEGSVKAVGFGPDEAVLPYPPQAHPAYRLVQEFFTFPSKYDFLDLDHLDGRLAGQSVDVLLLLDQLPGPQATVEADTFRLGCTPIINLFPQTTEPIRIDQTQPEYRLVPDERREFTTEIYQVNQVSVSTDPADDTLIFEPYFSFNHRMEAEDQKAFWHVRREETGRKDMPGTEVYLSLVDLNFDPTQVPVETVYAHTLCTNRSLANQIPAGAVLDLEAAAPLAQVTCLEKPTVQLSPSLGGASLWRLISHLSLNYLSLSGGHEGLTAFREILRLHSFSERPSTEQQIQGIRSMQCQPVMRRIGREAWRGFCQGTEVTLEFDEGAFVGSSAYLFASVLSHFLALYTSVNSFTQLVITSTRREGVWAQWPPMAGDQSIL